MFCGDQPLTLALLPPMESKWPAVSSGTMVECRPPVRPPMSCQWTPSSRLCHRKLAVSPASVAKYTDPSGARKALVIGCGVQSCAGASRYGSVTVQVAPLLVETPILNGSQGEVPRPPPKNRTVFASVQSKPD